MAQRPRVTAQNWPKGFGAIQTLAALGTPNNALPEVLVRFIVSRCQRQHHEYSVSSSAQAGTTGAWEGSQTTSSDIRRPNRSAVGSNLPLALPRLRQICNRLIGELVSKRLEIFPSICINKLMHARH